MKQTSLRNFCLFALTAMSFFLPRIVVAQAPTEVPQGRMNEYPYRFNGLLISDYDKTGGLDGGGRGSGVVAIHPKIILSAAHVIVDSDLSAKKDHPNVTSYSNYPVAYDVRWFGRFSGTEQPDFSDGASLVREKAMAADYADWAIKDDQLKTAANLPGATASKILWESSYLEASARDFVAFWGYEPFAGDYADRSSTPSASLATASTFKLFTGYPRNPAVAPPLDATLDKWRLYETGPIQADFNPHLTILKAKTIDLTPNVKNLKLYGGNSGGPVWVRTGNDRYLLAGILIRAGGQTVPLDAPYAKKAIDAAALKVGKVSYTSVTESKLGYNVGPGWSEVYGLGETLADIDTFNVAIPADGNYQIETAAAAPSPSLDTVGTLTGPGIAGSLNDDDSGEEKNFRFSLYLTKGTYKLLVRGAYPTLKGEYRLNVAGLTGNGTQQIQLMAAGKTTPIANYSSISKTTVALGTDFGQITGATPKVPTKTLSFNIRNTGGGVLTLTGTPRVTLSTAHASQFEVVTQPSISAIPARVGSKGISSTIFSIRYQPTSKGIHYTKVLIGSDSADDPTFIFTIRGSAPNLLALPAGDVTHLASASLEIPGWDNAETANSSALDYGGDIDMFRFVLTQPKLCTFWTTGDTDTYGTLYKLAGSTSSKLLSADAGGVGRNFGLTKVLDPGTYVVEVKGATADVIGDYELHASQTPVSGYAVLTNAKGIPISDGSTLIDSTLATDFGLIDLRKGSVDRVFTLTNNGFADISITGSPRVQISGAGAAAFIVVTQPAATVLKPAAKINFTLRYDPFMKGDFDAAISIPVTGAGLTDNTYNFAIRGTAFGSVEPLQRAKRIAASKKSSYFFDADGGAKEWGLVITMFGNFNSPSPTDSIFRFPSAPLAVAGGSNRFHVATADGGVLGWGYYSEVSLGYGENLGDDLWEESPQPASRLWGTDEAAQIAIGATHTVVATSSGGVWTWGDQTSGQLGNGVVAAYSNNRSYIKKTPQSITSNFGAAKIIQIAAGSFHTLALDSDGNVWSWGYGREGQLGIGTVTTKSAPTKISTSSFGGYRIVSVACAADSSFAVTEAGVVWAWGSNANGALGDGTLTKRTTPVMVTDPATGRAHEFGGQPIRQITVGSDQAFILTANGSVWTWGEVVNVEADMSDPYNQTAETLNSWTSVYQSPFLLVDGTTDPNPQIVEMTAAGQRVAYWSDDVMLADLSLTHALFLRANDSVWACGDNSDGQMGNGSTFCIPVPVEVIPAPPPTVAGDLDLGFDPSAGDSFPSGILATAMQPDGKIVIGGAFTTIGGTNRSYIARLAADGTLEATFAPTLNANVFCIAAQPDGKLIIGGAFTANAVGAVMHLTRLTSSGSTDTTFHANIDATVYCATPQADGKILVGGLFSSVGGVSRNLVARLNADGTLDAGFNAGMTGGGIVSSIVVQANGKIIIGGAFPSVGGSARKCIARLNSDGTLDTTFSNSASVDGAFSQLRCVSAQPDGKVLIAGNFSTISGVTRNGVARFNPDGTLDENFNPNMTGYSIFSITPQADGKIIVMGDFTSLGGTDRNRIARLNGDGSLDSGFDLAPSNPVLSGAIQADGKLIIGGDFTTLEGVPRHYIGRLLNDTAIQALTVSGTSRVQWLRSGASPEVSQVTFELSTNNGTSWTLLGTGARVSGGWEISGLKLPASGKIRARGRTVGGYCNGSSGLVEAVKSYFQ